MYQVKVIINIVYNITIYNNNYWPIAYYDNFVKDISIELHLNTKQNLFNFINKRTYISCRIDKHKLLVIDGVISMVDLIDKSKDENNNIFIIDDVDYISEDFCDDLEKCYNSLDYIEIILDKYNIDEEDYFNLTWDIRNILANIIKEYR